MRAPTYLIALVAIIAMLSLTGGVASADDPPGANGTVKVHEYPEHKNGSENANDPKVCRFEIHGNNLDSAQSGRWWIQEHKWGSGDSTKAVAPVGIRIYTANSAGDWTYNNGGAGFTIADGHYKLFVEMKHQAGNSGNTVVTYKHKVFKIECPTTGGGSNNGGSNNGGSNNGGSNNGGSNNGGSNNGGSNNGGSNNGGSTGTTGGGTTGGTGNATTGGTTAGAGGTTGQASAAAAVLPSTESAAAAALPSIAMLPSTSTAADTTGLAIGLAAISVGLAMLRRRTAAA